MLLPPGRCCSLLFLNVFGRCFANFVVTDVYCCCLLLWYLLGWRMLLPLYVIVHILGDVVAKVVDVIATV